MSCMEHTCLQCGHMEFNNNPTHPALCQKCGSDMMHQWDEYLDYQRDQGSKDSD